MTWLTQLRSLLGSFWYRLFDRRDFLLSVENLFAYVGGGVYRAYRYIIARIHIAEKQVGDIGQRRQILVDISSITPETSKLSEVSGISSIFSPVQEARYWTARTREPYGEPEILCDALTNQNTMLMRGLDFERIDDRTIKFKVDPATCGLTRVSDVVDDKLCNYYVLWPVYACKETSKEFVEYVAGCKDLYDLSEEVWAIHQRGATEYNIKALMAKAAGYAICKEAGTVKSTAWVEQGYAHTVVGNHIYSAPEALLATAPEAGSTLNAGDTVFGYDIVYTPKSVPSLPAFITELPVATTVGTFAATNATQQSIAIDDTGYYLLPLTGMSDEQKLQYKNNAKAILDTHSGIPRINIGDTINPCEYLWTTLWKNVLVVLHIPEYTDKISRAIEILKKELASTAMLRVVLK